jgi:hypothetical protein
VGIHATAMSNRIAIITGCDRCPHFDNEYYDFLETCTKLNRAMPLQFAPLQKGEKYPKILGRPIPEDCPLPKEESCANTSSPAETAKVEPIA